MKNFGGAQGIPAEVAAAYLKGHKNPCPQEYPKRISVVVCVERTSTGKQHLASTSEKPVDLVLPLRGQNW